MNGVTFNRNAKYFRPVSYRPGVALGLLGLVLLVSGSSTLLVIGLLLFGTGALLIFRQTSGRPSDEEIDSQVHLVVMQMRDQALLKLGLDLEEVQLIDPIFLGGYFIASQGTPSRVKKGKDGRIRTSNFEGVAIFFGEQELHSYKYQMCLIAAESDEYTDVYFYRDVVSVSTNSSSRSVTEVGQIKVNVWKFEEFALTTSGGTKVTCSMMSDIAIRNIQGARQLIRNKKMQTP